MSRHNIVYLCPSYSTYWVQLFDSFDRKLGPNFTVITQSVHDAINARIAQGKGRFQREILAGRRISLADGKSEEGNGTPFGLNIAPALPLALLRLRPRVVIANNFGLWPLAAILMGYKTVLFWEGTRHTERTVRPWRRRLRRWMARRAGAFVVNGSAARDYLTNELDVATDRVFIGSLCADSPPDSMRVPVHARRQPKESINFLFVGRLIRGKGVDHLLHAAASVMSRPEYAGSMRITILGDGPQRAELEILADELGLASAVEFVGLVHPDAIWTHYEGADVFVLPTLHDNWPLVVMEAMSVGLPVLLSERAGSLPDLIVDGKNGHGFDPEDHDELAQMIRGYIDHPDKIVEHGRNSLRIVKRYSPDRSVQAFIDATTRALARES